MVFQNWEMQLTEGNLSEEIAQAKSAWKKAEATEQRAKSVCYDSDNDLIVIQLKNHAIFSFPPSLVQGLESATEEQLADVWLSASGSSIHWESFG